MNLLTKQTLRYRKQIYGYQRGKIVGKDKLEVLDQHIQTTVYPYKIDKQGPTVQYSIVQQYYTGLYIVQETTFNIL